MDDPLHSATDRFAQGFNCAQAIFAAFSAKLGVSSELALRVAAPFGAGMGRAGEVCGALTGALMVLGLEYARVRPEYKDEIYAITREFLGQFRQRHGATLCRELVGYDISTPEGLQAARENKAFAKVCPLIVEETAQALSRYLSNHPAV
jgi:C_GCAxxG_C_C family probable redox protein